MPRVPLTQLKEQQKDDPPDNNTDEPVQKSAALWVYLKCICLQEINKKKGQEKHNDPDTTNGNIEVLMEETHLDKALPNASIELDDPVDRFSETDVEPGWKAAKHSVNGERRTMQNHQHLNINEEEMEAMKKIEMRLKKANRGKKLRVVVVESDSENDCAEVEENSCPNLHEDFEYLWSFPENVEIFESGENQESPENQAVRFIVQADVHHVPSGLSSEERGAAGLRDTEDRDSSLLNHMKVEPGKEETSGRVREAILPVDAGNTGGARLKQISKPEKKTFLTNQEVSGKTTGRRKTNENYEQQAPTIQSERSLTAALLKKKHQKLREVKWGDEESSESDGEWDWNGEDIPLVRR